MWADVPSTGVLAGVLGHPISHSLSPVIHRAALAALGLDADYRAYDVDEADFAAFVAQMDGRWLGVSVTMPLKKLALAAADETESVALATGAANTLVVRGGTAGAPRRLLAANTDVEGIIAAFGEAHGADAWGEAHHPHTDAANPAWVGHHPEGNAVIVGGGATASSALAALHALGWRAVQVCVRDAARASGVQATGERLGVAVQVRGLETWTEQLSRGGVVVSTLPAGVADRWAPAVAGSDLPNAAAGQSQALLLDVAYVERPSALGKAWQQAGGCYVSGEQMLLHQAVGQVVRFTGQAAPVAAMRRALADALA